MGKTRAMSIYMQTETLNEISTRGNNRSYIINRDLGRIYALYEKAIREIPLTLNEAKLLTEACRGLRTASVLWAIIEDNCHQKALGKKFNVDTITLVERFKDLTPIQALAIVDAVDRYWALPERNDAGIRRLFNVRP